MRLIALLLALALAGCGSPADIGEPQASLPSTGEPQVGGSDSPTNREAAYPASVRAYQVARVIDGDTIELEGGERVRLLCIDTPERGQPGYTEATEFLRELVAGKAVRLEADPEHVDRDRFGRLLRYVWLFTGGEAEGFSSGDGVLVNVEIVRRGYSVYETRWGASSLHAEAFSQAR
jgi:endonuclease YncB( thermonuclease family)